MIDAEVTNFYGRVTPKKNSLARPESNSKSEIISICKKLKSTSMWIKKLQCDYFLYAKIASRAICQISKERKKYLKSCWVWMKSYVIITIFQQLTTFFFADEETTNYLFFSALISHTEAASLMMMPLYSLHDDNSFLLVFWCVVVWNKKKRVFTTTTITFSSTPCVYNNNFWL